MGPHTFLIYNLSTSDVPSQPQVRARRLVESLRTNPRRYKRNHNRICVPIIVQERVLSDLGVRPGLRRILSAGDIAQNIGMGDDDDLALRSVAQPSAHPACPLCEGGDGGAVEAFFRAPARREEGKVEP